MGTFDNLCDQMTHSLQAHARKWTIVFTAIVAFVLPFDSIGVAKQLEKNPTEVQPTRCYCSRVEAGGTIQTHFNWLLVRGILISIGLMSLGAPFWFDALKNLLQLRPALASQEAGERTERATTQST